ncbi:MAG: hypothetical protein AAFV53_22670 [Myxococcota bacterium]
MRNALLSFLLTSLLLTACASEELEADDEDTLAAEPDTGHEDANDEDPNDEEKGDEDRDGEDTGGVDIPADAMIANHVIDSLEVGGRDDGFDLDGDGDVDNALYIAGALLDPVLIQALNEAPVLLVLQCAELNDWQDDAAFDLGLLTARDTDGDSSDNFSGTETFNADGMVDDDGAALLATTLALESGRYEGTLLSDTLTIGSFELSLATPIHLAGAPSEAAHDAVLGMGINTAALIAVLETAGYGDAAALLSGLSDLDTDEDGVNDAISAAFLASAVSCQLQSPSR